MNLKKNKHKKLIKLSKSFKGANSKRFKAVKQTKIKSLTYSYKGRKYKKKNYKTLWIKKINLTIKIKKYNKFISKLKNEKIILNKKILYFLTNFDKNNLFLKKLKVL